MNDPLVSWNDGETKQTLLSFVEKVTDPSSQDFVQPAQRIAVFDNDGTLWVEQPIYTQLTFTFDRVKALVATHAGIPRANVIGSSIKTKFEIIDGVPR